MIPALAEYADRLVRAGFRVHVPTGPGWRHLIYSPATWTAAAAGGPSR
jgi:hypothetical protein